MSGHGGARPGAGRKCPKTKYRINFTLSQSIIARLRKEDNMSETVELALSRYFEPSNHKLDLK